MALTQKTVMLLENYVHITMKGDLSATFSVNSEKRMEVATTRYKKEGVRGLKCYCYQGYLNQGYFISLI